VALPLLSTTSPTSMAEKKDVLGTCDYASTFVRFLRRASRSPTDGLVVLTLCLWSRDWWQDVGSTHRVCT